MPIAAFGTPADRADGQSGLEQVRSSALYVSQRAARTAAAVIVFACSAISLLAYVGIVQSLGPGDGVLALVCALAVLALQLGYFSRPRAVLERNRTIVALLAQAALVYLPIAEFGTFWLGFPGFLAGNLMLALPRFWGLAGFAAIVASTTALEFVVGAGLVSDFYAATYTAVSTALTGLVVYGLTTLARLVRQLHDARETLGRMAVAEERLRIARDAHDLLGLGLSAITLKAELGHRLVPLDPERARAEIGELLVISRRALADVRMLSSGRNSLSMDQELRTARSVLAAAEIEAVVIDQRSCELSDETGTLLATVLREAVTNVLRHSKAGSCDITIDAGEGQAQLVVANDGLREADDDTAASRDVVGGGSGIANLRRRVTDHGGRFEAGREGDRFVLTVSVPMPAA